MQQFFNNDRFSREKGFRCHKKRNRFWDIATLEHSQIDRTAWKSWSNTMNVQMTPYHVRWVDIEGQGANFANHFRMESVSSRLRMFLTLSADEISQHSGVYKHLLLWSLNRQILDRLHSMLFIIETKHSQRLLQSESATAWLNSPPIVLNKESKTDL